MPTSNCFSLWVYISYEMGAYLLPANQRENLTVLTSCFQVWPANWCPTIAYSAECLKLWLSLQFSLVLPTLRLKPPALVLCHHEEDEFHPKTLKNPTINQCLDLIIMAIWILQQWLSLLLDPLKSLLSNQVSALRPLELPNVRNYPDLPYRKSLLDNEDMTPSPNKTH